MPAVQHEIDPIKASRLEPTICQFLSDCQQWAIASNQAKIASLSFRVRAIAPWVALDILGNPDQRHFYYDSPHQSIVGAGCTVECSAAGFERFSRAQEFVNFWQTRFIYATLESCVGLDSRTGVDEIESAPSGHFFCSATFFPDRAKGMAPYFEPAHLFVPKVQVSSGSDRWATTSTVTFNCLMTSTTDSQQVAKNIRTQLEKLAAAPSQRVTARKISGAISPGQTGYRTSHEDLLSFEPAVKAAIEQIQANQLHKVVLADVMDVEGVQAFDEVRSLQVLRQNHPDCTVFSVSNGRGQSFIGASPERLLSITNGRFTTDALAGTASRGPLPSLDIQLAQTLINSQKEQFEHRLVVEFIVRQLRSLGLSPKYDALPKVLQLLHVQHLHTPISASISPPQSVSPLDILAKLHPTPAVAGVPHEAACQLIRQYETFDRGLYAAPIGWINTQGDSEFIVGIRSALLNGQKARLYAGAGIVAGSESQRELAEIKLKLQALLNALV